MDTHVPITDAERLELKRQQALRVLGRRYVRHPECEFVFESRPVVLLAWLAERGQDAMKRAGVAA